MQRRHRSQGRTFPSRLFSLLLLAAMTTGTASSASAAPGFDTKTDSVLVARAETMEDADHSGGAVPGKGSRPLEPRYQPLEPEEKGWYNGSYIFGLSRSLADSTIVPAAKAPLFVLTIPLDIAFLPFALIGGIFG